MSDSWYYAQGEQQLGPVPFETLRDLVSGGQLHAQSLVWNKTLTEWTPASRIPDLMGGEVPMASVASKAEIPPQLSPPSPPPPQTQAALPAPLAYASPPQSHDVAILSAEAMRHLQKSQVWIRFVAIVGMIGGILLIVIAIVRIVSWNDFSPRSYSLMIGLPQLIMGVLALMLAFSLNGYASKIRAAVQTRHPAKFELAMAAQKSYWRLVSLSIIVWFALSIGAVFLMVIL